MTSIDRNRYIVDKNHGPDSLDLQVSVEAN